MPLQHLWPSTRGFCVLLLHRRTRTREEGGAWKSLRIRSEYKKEKPTHNLSISIAHNLHFLESKSHLRSCFLFFFFSFLLLLLVLCTQPTKSLNPFRTTSTKSTAAAAGDRSLTHSLTHSPSSQTLLSIKTNNSSLHPNRKNWFPRRKKKDFGSIFYHRTNLGAGEPKVKEEAEPIIHELCFFFSFLPFCFFFSFWLLGCQPKQAAFWCACMQWKIRGEWVHLFVQCCNPSFLTDWISSLQPKCMGYLP